MYHNGNSMKVAKIAENDNLNPLKRVMYFVHIPPELPKKAYCC